MDSEARPCAGRPWFAVLCQEAALVAGWAAVGLGLWVILYRR